jgi:hypothetical protein
METITSISDRLIAFLGAEASLSNSMVKALLVLLAAFIVWLIVRKVLTTLENKAGHFKFLLVRRELFAIVRKTAGLLLIWFAGVIGIRLFNLAAIEKVFHAVFIILAATPVKSFLLIFLEILERNLAERTETAIDNIVIDLLNKFSGAIVYATAAVIALDVLGVNVMPFIAGAGVMGRGRWLCRQRYLVQPYCRNPADHRPAFRNRGPHRSVERADRQAPRGEMSSISACGPPASKRRIISW